MRTSWYVVGVGCLVGACVGCGQESRLSADAAGSAITTSSVLQLEVADVKPMRAVDGADTPAAVTGYEIGDRVDPAWISPAVDVQESSSGGKPAYRAVGINGIVVGYQSTADPWADTPPEKIDPTIHPELTIYDNGLNAIGTFIDGTPIIWKS